MSVDRYKTECILSVACDISHAPVSRVIQGLVLYRSLPDDPLLRLSVSGILSILVFGWIYREDDEGAMRA